MNRYLLLLHYVVLSSALLFGCVYFGGEEAFQKGIFGVISVLPIVLAIFSTRTKKTDYSEL